MNITLTQGLMPLHQELIPIFESIEYHHRSDEITLQRLYGDGTLYLAVCSADNLNNNESSWMRLGQLKQEGVEKISSLLPNLMKLPNADRTEVSGYTIWQICLPDNEFVQTIERHYNGKDAIFLKELDYNINYFLQNGNP